MQTIADKHAKSGCQADDFEFEATDVTAMRSQSVRGVPRSTPAGPLARTLAERMDLPTDTPWSLRSDATGTILEDDKPIADQISSGERVTLTPRSHLGCC